MVFVLVAFSKRNFGHKIKSMIRYAFDSIVGPGNPFAPLTHPAAILAAVGGSEALAGLPRRFCQLLDRTGPTQTTSEPDPPMVRWRGPYLSLEVPPEDEIDGAFFVAFCAAQGARTGVGSTLLRRILAKQDPPIFLKSPPYYRDREIPASLLAAAFRIYAEIPGLDRPVSPDENFDTARFGGKDVLRVHRDVAKGQIEARCAGEVKLPATKVVSRSRLAQLLRAAHTPVPG